MEGNDGIPWVDDGTMEIIVRWRKSGASAWSIEEKKCKVDMNTSALVRPSFIRLISDTVAAMVGEALNK